MCEKSPRGEHLWYTMTFTVPVKFVRDWCVSCGEPRPATTEQGLMTTSKPCKDCLASLASGEINKLPNRVAKHPGPRCTTHHRVVVRARKAANHEKRVQETYGLQKGEYAQLYEFQGGKCALCRRATGASRKLSVDHCHASGDVRGLLCRPCNTMLGHARDNTLFFERCIKYLIFSPYARMREGFEFVE